MTNRGETPDGGGAAYRADDETEATRELSKVTPGSGASMQQLAKLSETLLAMAAGDFRIRADRTYTRDPFDVLAYLVNNTADELENLIGRVERQNDQLESILESMVDGIILLDAEGFIRRTNRSMMTLIGVEQESAIINLPMTAIVESESVDTVAELMSAKHREPQRGELLFTTESGSETFPVVSSVVYSAGSTTGFVVLVQDDRELREARARAQLSDRMTAMGAMAAGVAHEINNPLAYVTANIDFILSLYEEGGVDSEEAREALVDALDGVRRVREIVADLNSFSRADDESKLQVDLRGTILSAVKMLSSDLKHRVHLEINVPELPHIEANEARLTQVFVNILLNALHALDTIPRDERRVDINARVGFDEVIIEVTDNGPGISKADLPRIFDAFFTTKPVGKGTGLGLAISHQTVTNLGGSIDVESTPGSGTRFRVVLPFDRNLEAVEPDTLSLSEASEMIVSSSVLIVDDELALANALKRLLSSTYDVSIVTDPLRALEIMREQEFGAVLCDVMMPQVSGIEIFQELKSARPELAERFIFMTGGAFTSSAQKFLETVEVPCLRKPFDMDELKRHIDRLIREG